MDSEHVRLLLLCASLVAATRRQRSAPSRYRSDSLAIKVNPPSCVYRSSPPPPPLRRCIHCSYRGAVMRRLMRAAVPLTPTAAAAVAPHGRQPRRCRLGALCTFRRPFFVASTMAAMGQATYCGNQSVGHSFLRALATMDAARCHPQSPFSRRQVASASPTSALAAAEAEAALPLPI